MKDKFFIDTNIFIYSFDETNLAKQSRSQELIKSALVKGYGIISTQVIQEFLNVATRKFAHPLTVEDATQYLHRVLNPLCQVYPTLLLYEQSLKIQAQWGISFYDSLIVAAALAGGCATLYTEDLQPDLKIENLIIINPYAI